MGNLFGKGGGKDGGKKEGITDTDQAILELKVMRDNFKKNKRKISDVVAKEEDVAKQMLRANRKKEALLCLRKKKYQLGLLDQAEAALLKVEQQISTIEQAQQDRMVFEAMKGGTAALKSIQKEVSLEAVEKLVDETHEAMEYQKEVEAMLSESLTDADESDVLAEYETIVKEMEASSVPNLPDVPAQLPDVPALAEPAVEEKEERVAVEA